VPPDAGNTSCSPPAACGDTHPVQTRIAASAEVSVTAWYGRSLISPSVRQRAYIAHRTDGMTRSVSAAPGCRPGRYTGGLPDLFQQTMRDFLAEALPG